jgi:hypothetical protein
MENHKSQLRFSALFHPFGYGRGKLDIKASPFEIIYCRYSKPPKTKNPKPLGFSGLGLWGTQ